MSLSILQFDLWGYVKNMFVLCFLSGAKAFNDEEEARKASKGARRYQNHDAGHLYGACGRGRDSNGVVVDSNVSMGSSRTSIVTEPLSKAGEVIDGTRTIMPPPQARNPKARKGTPQPKWKPKPRKVMSHTMKSL